MKINEIIELVNDKKVKMLTSEEKQKKLKKDLEIKDYLSIKTKKQLAKDVINQCVFYDEGIYKVDELDEYITFTMTVIAAYTNLELSDDLEEDYDILCQSGLLPCIIALIQKEYDETNIVLKMERSHILDGNNIEAQVGRFLSNILDKLDSVAEVIANVANKFDINSLLINKEDLTKVLDFVNKNE